LQGTSTDGMSIQPNADLNLDSYVDADFAGLWRDEDPQCTSSVKCRTGFVLTLGGAPVVW